MGISWGRWEYAGGNGMRIGMDVSWSSVSHGSSSVTATVKTYTHNQYNYRDPQKLKFSGSLSGETTFTNNGTTGNISLRSTKTYTYNYGSSQYGSSPGSRTFNAVLSEAYNGVTPEVSVTRSIPARPIARPDAPGSVSRSPEGSKWRISWTKPSTSAKPIKSTTWQRWSSATGRYLNIGTTSSSSWLTGSCPDNGRYRVRARHNNSAGSSGWTYSSTWNTKPKAPTVVRAKKTSTPGTIKVTWTNNAPHADHNSIAHYEDGVFQGVLDTSIPRTTSSYTVAGLDITKTHQFEVYTVTMDGFTFSSDKVRTNVVELDSPPGLPLNLSPNGQPKDADQVIRLSWEYVGLDSSSQTKFQIGIKPVGVAWDPSHYLPEVTSSDFFYDIAASTLTNGTEYEWVVRTWGIHPDPGPYSAPAIIKASSPPAVTIDSPLDGDILSGNQALVDLSFIDDEGDDIISVSVALKSMAGDVLNVIRDAVSIGSSNHSLTPAYRLENSTSYVIEAFCVDDTGMPSPVESITVTTDFVEPDIPTISGVWVSDSASVDLSVTVTHTAVPVESVTIEKSTDGGVTWEPVVENLDPASPDFRDSMPLLAQDTMYRAVAYSNLPSSSVSAPITITPEDTTNVWFTVGDQALPLGCFESLAYAQASAATAVKLKAKDHPVVFRPIHNKAAHATSYNGFLAKDSTYSYQDYEALLNQNVWVRDPAGKSFLAFIPTVDYTVTWAGTEINIAVIEVSE